MGFWPTPPSWGSVVVWEDVMDEIVSGGGPLVLDGGLATRLEAYGCDLRGDLWSARLLTDAPELIRQAHRDFFEAGADVAISAGYQASVDGFTSRGIRSEERRGGKEGRTRGAPEDGQEGKAGTEAGRGTERSVKRTGRKRER